MSFTETLKSKLPSSTTAWTAAGASLLTMAVGFTFVGWKTGGAAERMSNEAAGAARIDLASEICAANFVSTPAAFEQREELLALSVSRQRAFVQEQPWALLPGQTSVNRLVAERCAQLIKAMEPEALAALPGAEDETATLEVDPG